eukprot:g5526.t1
MRRGRRGSGRRRLRELTRSVVETMEILEEVRETHSGVGGMSKALTQVVKLGLKTCLVEPEDREYPGNTTNTNATPSVPSSVGAAGAGAVAGTGNAAGGGSRTAVVGKTRASIPSSTVFLESGVGGAGGAGEEALPLGVACVLGELECCAAQSLVTLMNLSEGRPNHFGVFRACVYVQEIRMLEAKILELVHQADNPREEKNATLETTIAAGIRNCVARLWWSRRAGENAESMTWDAFEEAFQQDFGEQLPKTMEVLRKHIAVEKDDYRTSAPSSTSPITPPQSPPHAHPATATTASLPGALRREKAPRKGGRRARKLSATARREQPRREEEAMIPPPPTRPSPPSNPAVGASPLSSMSPPPPPATCFNPGAFAAAAAAIEATTARLTAAVNTSANPPGNGGVGGGGGGVDHNGASNGNDRQETAAQAQGSERVVFNVETGEEEYQQQEETVAGGAGGAGGAGAAATMAAASQVGALERGFSHLLLSVRRDRAGARVGRAIEDGRIGKDGGGGGGGGGGGAGAGGSSTSTSTSTSTWCVTAALFEEATWTHGGLYEAFQALADPRRVVFALGVVDDGPHMEGDGGGGGEGWPYASPVVVQGLLGLSVQQVCCGGQHAAVLTDCGEIFTWGRGGFGRLGHGNREGSESPKRIEALEGIPCVQVACGFAYTAAVTASGELYTWGAGENGRLGLGDVEDRHKPSRVEGLHSKVKEVYAGSVHSCVLTREGTVYAFGKHEYTGHGEHEDVLEPRLIPIFSGGDGDGGRETHLVRQISVGPGGYHTMALTCQGQVYAWGHNRVAQLGIGNHTTVPRNMEGAYFLPCPQLVESLVGMNIVKVVAGWGHSAALTVDGQLYVCGRNYQGQLGLGSPQGFPQNERGHPFQAHFCLVDRLQHLKIRQIACGGEHSVAVAENGEVWSFGAGQKGQLGHGSINREDFPRLVQALKRTRREILHVACGNNCTLVLAGEVAFPTLSR